MWDQMLVMLVGEVEGMKVESNVGDAVGGVGGVNVGDHM